MKYSIKSIDKLTEQFQEPIKTYLKREGFDPGLGGIIVFPEKFKESVCKKLTNVPDYLKFSKHVEHVTMVKTKTII